MEQFPTPEQPRKEADMEAVEPAYNIRLIQVLTDEVVVVYETLREGKILPAQALKRAIDSVLRDRTPPYDQKSVARAIREEFKRRREQQAS